VFDAKRNQTVIWKNDSGADPKAVKPGLVLVRLATNKSALAIELVAPQ